MRLAGKVALITGGASGMGQSEAMIFAREGARVVVGDLLEVEGRQVVDKIAAGGGQSRFVKLDVTSEAWEENDIAFHAALAAATGNPLAVRMMAILRDSFSAFYRLKRYIPSREEQKLIWQHHADVYEAVRRRSHDRARTAIIGHMDFIEAKLAESLEAFDANNEKD